MGVGRWLRGSHGVFFSIFHKVLKGHPVRDIGVLSLSFLKIP